MDKRAMVFLLVLGGCGGGGGSPPPDCSFFSNSCRPEIGPTPPVPGIFITPFRQTVQVGTQATFSAQASNLTNPTYAWCRASTTDATCVALPDATGSSYTLPSVDLADDGARFRVTASAREGGATSGFARLAVSPLPSVVYQDGDFAETDWVVTAVVTPAQSGATYSFSRVADGGHPGAYRSATYDLPATKANSVRIFHSAVTAIYYPTSQGAIHVIDFSEDCMTTSLSFGPGTIPLIEQADRRFIAAAFEAGCVVNGWTTASHPSLSRDEFVQVDGPACGSGESCPDFSDAGAPIRFGLVGVAETLALPPTAPAIAHFAHAFDNWKVGVWRK